MSLVEIRSDLTFFRAIQRGIDPDDGTNSYYQKGYKDGIYACLNYYNDCWKRQNKKKD